MCYFYSIIYEYIKKDTCSENISGERYLSSIYFYLKTETGDADNLENILSAFLYIISFAK